MLALLAGLIFLRGASPSVEPIDYRTGAGGCELSIDRSAGVCGCGALSDAQRLLLGLPIDLNRAERVTLMRLPGIGPARADAIEVERARRPLRSVEALRNIHGIGAQTVAGLSPFLYVESDPACREGTRERGSGEGEK